MYYSIYYFKKEHFKSSTKGLTLDCERGNLLRLSSDGAVLGKILGQIKYKRILVLHIDRDIFLFSDDVHVFIIQLLVMVQKN